MTCQNCGFCKEDLETLESRGVYNVTRALEQALNKCDCIGTMRKDDRKYMENIENDVNSDGWNVEDKISLLKAAQGLIQLYQRDFTPQPMQHRAAGFVAMLDAASGVIERSLEEEEQPIIRDERHADGFTAMLDAAAHGISSEKKEDTYREAPIVRGYGMGFKAMLDGAANGTIERSYQDVESNPPVQCDGFLGMLEDCLRGTPKPRIIMRMAHR